MYLRKFYISINFLYNEMHINNIKSLRQMTSFDRKKIFLIFYYIIYTKNRKIELFFGFDISI